MMVIEEEEKMMLEDKVGVFLKKKRTQNLFFGKTLLVVNSFFVCLLVCFSFSLLLLKNPVSHRPTRSSSKFRAKQRSSSKGKKTKDFKKKKGVWGEKSIKNSVKHAKS